MTHLALNTSRYINGVAKRHGEVSRLMFAGYQIDAITNGVHVATWASKPFQELYDRHIPDWRQDNFSLRYAESIPKDEVWKAHGTAKQQLLTHLRTHTGLSLDPTSSPLDLPGASQPTNDLTLSSATSTA